MKNFIKKIINLKILLTVLFVFTIITSSSFAANNPITNAATAITSTGATLNATNGSATSTGSSFWVATTTFSTASPVLTPGVTFSTPDLGGVAASANFTATLNSTGIPILPNTTYYVAAWSSVGGTWYSGTIQSFTTSKLSQTINFNFATTTVKYGGATFIVNTATTTSNLAVSLTSVTASVCTVSGFTVTVTGAGTCTLNADQAGNGTYDVATQVSQSFTVGKKDITISGGDFVNSNMTYNGTTNTTVKTNPTGLAFSGVINNDDSTTTKLDVVPGTGTLASRNASTTGTVVTFSGYTLTGTKSANYNLTNQPSIETQIVDKKPITVTSITDLKTYDGTASSGLTPNINVAVATGDTANFTQFFATPVVGIGNKVINATGTVTDGNNGLNYNVTFVSVSNGTINSKVLTVTGLTASNKVYDGTTAANSTGIPTLVGLIAADTANVILGGSMLLNFTGPNPTSVGIAKPVNVSGLIITGTSSLNYTLTQPTLSANISVKELTVSGLSAANKVYNQNTVASITGSPVLVGGVSADSLPAALSLSGSPVGAFINKNVASAKLVNISGLSIIGTSIGNYFLTAPTSTATITPTLLIVTASGINKVYDGSTSGTVTFSDNRLGGDILVATGTVNFNNKTATTTKLVTVTSIAISGADASNYSLASTTATTTANITKKDMTATAITDNKVYDANTTASTTLNSVDKVSGDVVTYNKTSSNFSNKDVANGKVVTTNGISIAGADALNYNLLSNTAVSAANITARTLSVTINAVSKVYDASTTAAISTITSNVIVGDTIGTLGSASANFNDKNVGTAKLVTVNLTIGTGVDNTNYIVPSTATTTANITKRTLAVSATGINKVYGGNTGATVNFTDNRLGTDVFTVASSSATFDTKNVGVAKVITITGLSLSGTDAGNYSVSPTSITTSADIIAKSATITAENKTKTYGSVDPTLTATTTGLIVGDVLTGSLTRVAGENVGTYDITAGMITAGNNYVITFATGTFTIVKANQVITIDSVSNKNPNDTAFNIIATTTSGLPLTLSATTTNVCTVTGTLVTLIGATGTCQINTNQSGNANYNAATQTSIVINVIDTIAPIITINGSANVVLSVGDIYTELGATVYDFMSGTTTATISTSTVNMSAAGRYVVKYNAIDTSNNVAIEKIRTVTVNSVAGLISSGNFGGGSLALDTNNNLVNISSTNSGANLQVLGVSKFKFNKNLSLGMKNNNDVRELQKALFVLGLYKGIITSGNFDTELFEAVKAYQKINKVTPVSGYFGPKTRVVINK